MFTQCPECDRTQTISVEALRKSRGMIRCSNCSTLFDALQRLSEIPLNEPLTETASEPPWTFRAHRVSGHWGLLLLLSFITLTGQILYFEGSTAIQNETVRPSLEKACGYLKCTLPSYRNLDDFAVMHSALTPSDDEHYIFQATINNQAAFPQRPPRLRLTFMKLTGEPFAQRIFEPENYLASPTPYIGAEQPFDISLNIAPIDTTMGGYNFELI